ncbi:MAG TPA: hypothetical protein VFM46_19970 [Pseudomonadales bacterium]|nr:hypothetical protein [Pseudomonadales bacterium]
MKNAFAALAVCCMLNGSIAHAAAPTPPERQASGFGSTENYIADSFTVETWGTSIQGTLTTLYRPAVLKNGSTAPVLVFLHGFSATKPSFYKEFIEHVVKQGNFVIFPQFQRGDLVGILAESGLNKDKPFDHQIWLHRAISATNEALAKIQGQADLSQLYLAGHSLGGALSLGWKVAGGPRPKAMMLEHAEVDSAAGLPPFVKPLVHVKEIPFAAPGYADAIDWPVVILTGENDTIATVAQQDKIFSCLTGKKSYYIAHVDAHGKPLISPNHGGPLGQVKPLPPHKRIVSGISLETDMLDWRYYAAGIDAVMSGVTDIPFDFGQWSDGVAVIPPSKIESVAVSCRD